MTGDSVFGEPTLVGVESGQHLTTNQVLRGSVHGDLDVEVVEAGEVYVVDGERFEVADE